MEIAILKLSGAAKLFYQGSAELHAQDATWQTFKKEFRQRYKDVQTDQFHYMRLQTARQVRNEGLQKFAYRCRALAQKIRCKANDPVVQCVHQENAERMLPSFFLSGLMGAPVRQCRYANPQSMQEALRIAISVQEAEKQERFKGSFYTSFDSSVSLQSQHPNRTRDDREKPRHSGATRAPRNTNSQRPTVHKQSTNQNNRKARNREALLCFECQDFGHFMNECPTRLRREKGYPLSPGKRGQTERSRRNGSPSKEPPRQTKIVKNRSRKVRK